MSPGDPRALRDAFGAFLTGVTVVTTTDADGLPLGFTANSYTSVSLDPPLLLVCPARSLSSFACFETTGHFAVSVLAEGQEQVSNTFAGFKGDRFAEVGWHPDAAGCPLMDGAAATFSCMTHARIPAGDHLVLIGLIQAFTHSRAPGLGYAAGGYFSLSLERRTEQPPAPGRRAVAGAVIEHEGRVLLERTAHGLLPPAIELDARSGVRDALSRYFAGAGLSVSLGPVYSIFDDDDCCYTYFRATTNKEATGGLGHFVAADELPNQHFATPAHAQMLRRYALERRDNVFGLYVGNAAGGDVHDVQEAAQP